MEISSKLSFFDAAVDANPAHLKHSQTCYTRPTILPKIRHHQRVRRSAFVITALIGCTKSPVEQILEPEPQETLVLAEAEPNGEAEVAPLEPEIRTLEDLCVLPPTLPLALDDACRAVNSEFDAVGLRHFQGEALERWRKAKHMQLEMTYATCMRIGSIEVAACQAWGLSQAGYEYRKRMPDILKICVERFG